MPKKKATPKKPVTAEVDEDSDDSEVHINGLCDRLRGVTNNRTKQPAHPSLVKLIVVAATDYI